MDTKQDDRQRHNQAEQTRLYGAPLAEVVDDLTATFAISRGALAQVLGLSAPMLSQLATAHRVKIGNPAAVHRLQRLLALLADVRSGQLTAAEALRTVEAEEPGQVLTRTTQLAVRRGAADVQQLLRATGSAADLMRAADLLQEGFPALADLVRIYGMGRNDEAAAHFQRFVAR